MELSGPHVHRSSVAATGSRLQVARKGPCSVDRPRATPPPRATGGGLCPVDRPGAAAATGPQPRAALVGARSCSCEALFPIPPPQPLQDLLKFEPTPGARFPLTTVSFGKHIRK
ncbi:unnamed protein product [Sphagnum jensenii]|uniref:Uncharacterized protein n=1 Tax=Sphagnum jensenii TaxID=128206 RepID=A0ABP1AN23_9BRYO